MQELNKAIDLPTENVSLSRTLSNLYNPEVFTSLATDLQKFVQSNGLISNIKGNNYVNVEGWQLAGNLLGLFPRLVSLDCIPSAERVYKYAAKVEIIESKTGKVVSVGIAICSNQEKSKQYFDEYAIASMAQTRAMGKAFRMCLGWLMKASGFEATPTEEMERDAQQQPLNHHVLEDYRKVVYMAIDNANMAIEIADLMEVAKNTFVDDAHLLDYARKAWSRLIKFEENARKAELDEKE